MQNMPAVFQNSARESAADEDLVVLAQNGDDLAAGALISRYYKSCLKQALHILRDYHDAEDEVQNACWKAVAHIGQFQRDAKFSTWLTRIVLNQCLMRLRQQRRARLCSLETGSDDGVPAFDLPDSRHTPEQDAGRSQIGEVVRREVKSLPPIFRDVLELRDVQNRAFPDVARILGISVAAAKSRLLRARSELRSRLAKHQTRLGAFTLTPA